MSDLLDPSGGTVTAFCVDDGAALLVALDFDGTLAPLVDDPTASRMTPAARAAVDRLGTLASARDDDAGAASRIRLAFVSGRELTELAERSDPPVGSYLVGSHGAQTGHATTEGLESVPLALTDDQSTTLAELTGMLEDAVVGREGAWVQHKPSAAVLHTRQAGPEDTAAAVAAAEAAAARLGLEAMRGKDVVEIAVLHTSKGEALDRLRDVVAADTGAQAVRVLYAGDDTTDEKAFAVLGDTDLALKVGDGETVARARVADSDGVADVLSAIADQLDAGRTESS